MLAVCILLNVERSDFPKVHRDPQSGYHSSDVTRNKYSALQLYLTRRLYTLACCNDTRTFLRCVSIECRSSAVEAPDRRGIIFVKRRSGDRTIGGEPCERISTNIYPRWLTAEADRRSTRDEAAISHGLIRDREARDRARSTLSPRQRSNYFLN